MPSVAGRLAARALLVALATLGATLATHRAAEANGVPTLVPLSYIDLSNWGPQDATGELELIFAEGLANLSAEGMTRLSDELYQGWLVNSESNDAISVGRFNADVAGNVLFQGLLPPISDFGFDLFIITVEPEPDEAPQPTTNRSIGGTFSLVGAVADDGSNEASISQPAELPNTGDPTLITDLARFGLLLAVMAVSVFVGLRLGRRTVS
jgi:hypothetical protein